MKNLQIFWWAMLHHPEFRYCYWRSPVEIGLNRFSESLVLFLRMQNPALYIPYSVQRDYWAARNEPTKFFDDIPF